MRLLTVACPQAPAADLAQQQFPQRGRKRVATLPFKFAWRDSCGHDRGIRQHDRAVSLTGKQHIVRGDILLPTADFDHSGCRYLGRAGGLPLGLARSAGRPPGQSP